MTTTGTVATTTIDNSKILEHGMRRAGVPPDKQTPEIVNTGIECLYMLLLGLSSKGINLWTVDHDYIGVNAAQATYVLPLGSLEILGRPNYCMPTQALGTNSFTGNTFSTNLGTATVIQRIGVMFSAVSAIDTISIVGDASANLVSKQPAAPLAANVWYWFNLDPSVSAVNWTVSTLNACTISQFFLASAVAEIPISPWSRDTYMAQNNKFMQGRPGTNFYFEKLLAPQFTLWPVPNTSSLGDHVSLFVYRQPQDVGSLTNTLEIPQRWIDAVPWLLAKQLMFELPSDIVDMSRYPMVQQEAGEAMITVERREDDGMPFYLTPAIRGYTRG